MPWDGPHRAQPWGGQELPASAHAPLPRQTPVCQLRDTENLPIVSSGHEGSTMGPQTPTPPAPPLPGVPPLTTPHHRASA